MKQSVKFFMFLMSVLMLTATIIIGCYALLTTTKGAEFVVALVTPLIPGKVKIERVSGKLNSHLTLQNISISNKAFDLKIEMLFVSWQPRSLLNKIIMIDRIDAKNIIIRNHDTSTSRTPLLSLEPPTYVKAITLSALHIANIQYTDSTMRSYQIDDLSYKKIEGSLYALDLQSPDGNITGTTDITWNKTLRWDINLKNEKMAMRLFAPTQTGHLNFLLTAKGTWNKQLSTELHIDELQGDVNRHAIKGSAFIAYEAGMLPALKIDLTSGNTILALSGRVDTDWQLKWLLAIPSLKQFNANIAGDFKSSGTIQGVRETPLLTANFFSKHLSFSEIAVTDLHGDMQTSASSDNKQLLIMKLATKKIMSTYYPVDTSEFKIIASLSKQYLDTEINGSVNRYNKIAGKLTLPIKSTWLDFTKPITGNVLIDMTRFNTLPIHIPETNIESGQAAASIAMTGDLAHPLFAAKIVIKNATASIKKFGIVLQNINLEGSNNNTTLLDFHGGFTSGQGTGNVKGTIKLDQPTLDIALRLSGTNLIISNLSEYKINASPDVAIDYRENNITINGNIQIPSARITPKYSHDVTALPNDVIFVRQKTEATSFLNNLSTNLQITLSNDILADYDKLKATLTGNFSLIKRINGPFTASGLLYTLKGKYTAYGKELDIEEGRLTYAGNILANPGLTIRAVKEINVVSTGGDSPLIQSDSVQPIYTGSSTMTIGVMVYGTLDNPVISFFSEPAGMSQEDILSYLLFGYPRSSITSASSMMLLNNTLASAKSGASFASVTNNIQANLGLNELGVKTLQYFNTTTNTTDNTTAFTVGKSLGDKLSLHYSFGIFQPVSVLTARFKITNTLILQAETNVLENGADLLYEIEKD